MRLRSVSATIPAIVVLAGLITLPGCSSPERDTLATLVENRALWESRRPARYSFEFREGCYCGPPANLTLHTVVEGNTVVVVEVVPDDANAPNAPEPQLAWGRTVDDIFDEIVAMAEMDPALLEVTWDPHWGIPLAVSYDWRTSVADDERWFTLTSFEPLD
jgi:hypothetical protein